MRRTALALTLVCLALLGAGCEESQCEAPTLAICKACNERAIAAAAKKSASEPAGNVAGQPPTPGAFDLDSCIERTRQACEQRRSPPNCPF